jgi:transcriptional regulator with XRE-family HTH domain
MDRHRKCASSLLAWNLRRHRVSRGISQERLAAGAHMARGYVARMERGLENPTLGTLDRLAEALSVPVAEFFVAPKKGEPAPKPLRGGRPKKSAAGKV